MNRRVAIAFSLLTLLLLVSCGDGGTTPPQPDIEATVEARVAKALSEASTPSTAPAPTNTPIPVPTVPLAPIDTPTPVPTNTPIPILAPPQTFAESVITAFKQPSFGEWNWRTGFDEGNTRVTVGTSHQNSGITLSGDVVVLIVPLSGNPVVDEYSALYIRTLTILSCPEKDTDSWFWREIDAGVNQVLTFRSGGGMWDNSGQYIPFPPTFGNTTRQCHSKAIGFRGLSLNVLEMVVSDTEDDVWQLWRDAVNRR